MRRNLYNALGGFDERYLGWGAEDDAITVKLQRMTTELAVLEGRAAVHLWHERGDLATFGNPHSVSYTHLDVYKRQAAVNASGRCAAGGV